ncbi:restriction endonuclease subunit S [Rhizobium sp. BK251]|uniref:restriction endonuclease subunit S n=1 Tax=Rhizobium sp. BK251 TaxID=2512125 RepID=UPI0010F3DCAE|nr:restriction endonuclease subunit S [Rhizobium sp. BK251]TCL62520.1 type I restriction enzyme S subunit [Rhizobium sp. BK251]
MSERRAYPKSVQAGIPKLGPKPRGWSTYTLGDLLTVVERPILLEPQERYQLVTAKRNRGGIIERGQLKGRSIKTKTQFVAKSGDFLISRRQIAHGACGIVPASLDNAVVSNEYVTLQPTQLLNINFLKHLTNTIYFQQTCFHSSIGVHVEKLVFNLEHWMTWQFHLPPLHVQRRIAAVLDEWDEAIARAETLAGAKRQQRDWLTDELTRTNNRQAMSELAHIVFSTVDKKTAPDEIKVRICNYLHVLGNRALTDDLRFDTGSATAQEIERFGLQLGDVVFTKDSETAEEIAEVSVVMEQLENVVCGYHLAVARPLEGIALGRYVAHALRNPSVRNEFVTRVNGAVRFGLTMETMDQIEIPLPSLETQLRVADILDTADSEITSLLRYIDQLRLQKRSLVQKLLTGDWPVPASIDRLLSGGQDIEHAVGVEEQRAEATG